MSEKTSVELQAVKIATFIFLIAVLIIFLLALYVKNVVDYQPTLTDEVVEQNLASPGRLYEQQ